jgi:virginiamycin B lyase
MTRACAGWIARWTGVAMAALCLVWSAGAGAQTFSDFTIPTGASIPVGITAGPDGALWFTESSPGKIGRVTTSGSFNEFPLSNSFAGPLAIVSGPDGNLWFVESVASKIGRITTSGSISEFPVTGGGSDLAGIALGPDGALWFTDQGNHAIGRITTSGAITKFPLPPDQATGAIGGIAAGSDGALWYTNQNGQIDRITTAGKTSSFSTLESGVVGIAAGPDGALWYTYIDTPRIGRITTSGVVSEFTISQPAQTLVGIAPGPDGAMWFSEGIGEIIGRLTTAGQLSEFTIPNSIAEPLYITAGPDGAMWFTVQAGDNFGSIGRITTPAGSSTTTPLVAAVLPESRSVEIGSTATAFATIINSGGANATGCAIVPVTPVPAAFVYQTTNPATNQVTGTANTPVSIGAGGSQSFVIAFTPSAPFVPTDVALGFDCSNTAAAASVAGLDTLLLSGSSGPVPDIVALAASATPGIVTIPGATGTGVFAVATVNLGASAGIIATANTGGANLPVTLSLCETNPASGACLQSPSSSVTIGIATNATPTFGIFVTGGGTVPFAPATNRITVQFTDSTGAIRGATSVAVETQ